MRRVATRSSWTLEGDAPVTANDAAALSPCLALAVPMLYLNGGFKFTATRPFQVALHTLCIVLAALSLLAPAHILRPVGCVIATIALCQYWALESMGTAFEARYGRRPIVTRFPDSRREDSDALAALIWAVVAIGPVLIMFSVVPRKL